MKKFIILLLNISLYVPIAIDGSQQTDITYPSLQKQLSLLLQQWHPISVEREKYSITPFGIILRLLAGDIMAGPALTANYLNQYSNPGKVKETINKATLAFAAMSAAPAIYGILEKTGGSIYDAFTYPNIELIKEQNKKVTTDILKIDKQLTMMEQNNPALNDDAQKEAYADIKILFKQPETWLATLTFKNTHKERLDAFFANHTDYNPEKLRLLLERNKARLITEIETPQKVNYPSSSSKQLTINPTQAIVGGIAMLPGMLLEAYTTANEEAKKKTSLNQDVALIDTILTTLATYSK
ncbi:MAG TPA: hypothetical protein VKU36_03680 [Candidatus Babeliales bacterium]|nr:hypothetical protein [Candidatus Babeliales bacterium]